MAVCNDCSSYKVKNPVILSGLAAGLVIRISEYGVRGIFVWGIGAFIPIAVLWILFCYRMLGAGDIKLFSIIGAMYGVPVILNTMILAFFAGGVLSFIRLVQTGGFRNRLQYLADFISSQYRKREFICYYQSERDGRTPVIHFTIAILVGFLICRFGEVSFLG